MLLSCKSIYIILLILNPHDSCSMLLYQELLHISVLRYSYIICDYYQNYHTKNIVSKEIFEVFINIEC
jgi:hypothetical protein